MAGLHDIAPIVEKRWVNSAVFGAHARGRGRGLTAGVAAADDDDVEARIHWEFPNGAVLQKQTERVKALFHVKQRPRLFADAEIAKNHLQNVLDIDSAGQAAQGLGGEPQLLGDDVLPTTRAFGQGPGEGLVRDFQRFPMPFTADQGRLGSKEFGRMPGEVDKKRLETFPSGRRKNKLYIRYVRFIY